MASLSSRQPVPTGPTQQEVLDAAKPAVNLIHWIASMIQFPDDSPRAVRAAAQTVEDALECLLLPDYAVMPIPGFMGTLHYNVAVKPIAGGPFVGFQIVFRIQP